MRTWLTAVLLCEVAVFGQTSVTTYHNDNARSGIYPAEAVLTPSSLKGGTFTKRVIYTVDGTIYGQPLYVPRVNIANEGLRDVVFVATGHDSIYAFDADGPPGVSAQSLWQVNFLDAAKGVTTVPTSDVNCPVIAPELGIVGTPVIDPTTGTLYAIAETKEAGPSYVFRLHAIDITSGAERPGSPVVIQAPGFEPLLHKQRAALLLSNGVVYSAWSSHCDHNTYHGWLMAHDAATLKFLGAFNPTPYGNGASLWNGGAGPSADAAGDVYVVTANGTFEHSNIINSYGNSVLRLSPALAVLDYFTPYNQATLDDYDLDLGSSGALLLPPQAGSTTRPNLLFTAGKEGRMYLLNRDSLGRYDVASDAGAIASLPVLSQSAFGMATYFNQHVYIASESSQVRAYPLSNATLGQDPSFSTSDVISKLGATPSISANGTNDGVLWMMESNNFGTLAAYDTSNLDKLWDSGATGNEMPGVYVEFTLPTIADGKVFVPVQGGVIIYGETSATAPVITGVGNGASFDGSAIAPGSLISIFGSGLALTPGAASSVPLPISLNDVSVTVGGVPAALVFISASQINAQVPAEVSTGTANVVVRVGGGVSAVTSVKIAQAAPGIFATSAGFAAALNQDGTVNGSGNPAPAGSVISLFFTGAGVDNDNLVADGVPAPATPVQFAAQQVAVTIGGSPATVLFSGLAPGLVGVFQANVQIPAGSTGAQPAVITVGQQSSKSVMIAIR